MILRHILAGIQIIKGVGGPQASDQQKAGHVFKILSGVKGQALWEDLGGGGRPRLNFLTICFRKEGADRGGIVIRL